MRTDKQILALMRVLWDNERTPYPIKDKQHNSARKDGENQEENKA